MALIELDLTAQPGPVPPSIPPARRYRTSGLVLAVALVFVLGGAGGPDTLGWRFLGTIASPPIPESPFQLDGDRVYTAGGLGDHRTVSAWSLAKPPAKLWSVAVPAREIGPDQVAYGDVRAATVGDVVLITDGPETTAVDARTGAARWHTAIGVHPLTGGRVGLVQDPKFRAGTEYNQAGGAPGDLYFSATGVPHDQPPVTTEFRGVDLRTGATAWTASAPGSVVYFDHPSGVVVLASDRLTLLSSTTGAVRRAIALPTLAGQQPQSGRLIGDLVLVSYGSEHGDARSLVAYSVRTFQQLWRVPQAKELVDPGVCAGLVCADAASGVSVLDPATGHTLWHAPGLDLVRVGADVLEQDTGTSDAVRVVDPANGDDELWLKGWSSDITAADGSPLLLRRTDDTRVSMFALVEDDPVALRPLGATHGVVSDCATDSSFVVCRGTGVLQVFSYRG
ncbi:PQQ-binding-like beta-propeller repeat protein [Actinoplanes sp. NPDC051411]|uniref:outer membrane protein assembly factor BamB family protein n=1 Tax=Actinoplanes sp. NPDC051411 TaxID=3155522 RepID=UPI00342A5FFA